MRRGVENGRDDLVRSRSSSPSLRAGHLGPEHLMMEEEMEIGTAGSNASTHFLLFEKKVACGCGKLEVGP
eukprot:8620412-Prorocentrum_lima.AAC.1